MIEIILSNQAYYNDVYPLVKAFYPEEEIRLVSREEAISEELLTSEETFTRGVKKYKLEEATNLLASIPERIGIDLDSENIKMVIDFIEHDCHRKTTIFRDLKLEEIEDQKAYKNAMKRHLYEIFSKASKKTLPWGILTGIRPTKIIYEMLERGMEEAEIFIHMKEEYLCSEEKVAMSIGIAKREKELLESMDYKNGYSIYIGIPFCPSTCLYCSFTSYSITKFEKEVERYLEALEKELLFGSTCFPNKKLTTVYLGGGTPTTLTAKQLDRLLGFLKKHFDFSQVKEFCVEAGRPDSITKEKLEVLKKWGVDRISINPQSMQQKTLDLIGRKHTVEEVKEAFWLARETGHDNINMDIIIGLPGEKPEDVLDSLKQIQELNPDSLTVHTLALKRAARLNMEKEQYEDLKAQGVSKMMDMTMRFAEDNHYLPYYLYRQKNMAENLENIGYARYGKEGIYNILIMEEQQTILAFGAGALSKFVFHEEHRIERVDNVKSITDYIGRIDEMIERKRLFLERSGIGGI